MKTIKFKKYKKRILLSNWTLFIILYFFHIMILLYTMMCNIIMFFLHALEIILIVFTSGNPNDKVLFARCRSMPGRLERRHSLRLWGSARRLHRSGSSRSLPRRPERSDTSSSAEYASTDSAPHSPTSKSGRGRDCVVMGDRFKLYANRFKNAF